MKVNVLGTTYSVSVVKYDDDQYMKEHSFDGYCDSVLKRIVICDMSTFPNCKDETKEWCETAQKQTLRHEIVHAFFNESGLMDCSLQYSGGWAKNEELVDWLACQGPKIYAAWREAGALDA